MVDEKQTNDLARRIVAVAAPGEADYFDELAAGAKAGKGLLTRSGRQDPLRAGFPDAAQILTPAIIYVAGKIVELLLEIALRKTGKRARVWLSRWIFVWRRPAPQQPAVAGPEHRGLVHDRAVRSAMEFGLSEEDAEQLALTVVSVVVLDAGNE